MGLRFSGLKMANPSESEIMSTTILVDVQLQRTDAAEHDASLQELRQLIETLGWKIAGALTQKMSSITAASLIGPGKLEELSELVKASPEVDSVVFDHELTTTQVRNIGEATGVDVYDRPAIILERVSTPDNFLRAIGDINLRGTIHLYCMVRQPTRNLSPVCFADRRTRG